MDWLLSKRLFLRNDALADLWDFKGQKFGVEEDRRAGLKPGCFGPRYSRTRRRFKGISKELGQADSEDLRSGPPDLPNMPGANADSQRD